MSLARLMARKAWPKRPTSWETIMIKAAATLGAALILAAVVSVLPAPPVAAGQDTAAPVATTPAAQAESQGTCTPRAWPYGQDCDSGFDARWRGEPRKVRLVTTDRLN
jgi:hypothetical protein